MRALAFVSCIFLASVSVSAQERPGSPAEPQNLSLPVTVDESTVKLPAQVPNYLNESAGWKLLDEKTGSIPVKAASKEGLWSLTANFRARLRVYGNETLGLEVYVYALKTAKETFTDISLGWALRDGTLSRYALRTGDKWVLAKKVLGANDELTIENNVVQFVDKLDDATRTITLKARLETVDGLKEVEFKFE